MGKLRSSKVNRLVQSHTAHDWQRKDPNSDHLQNPLSYPCSAGLGWEMGGGNPKCPQGPCRTSTLDNTQPLRGAAVPQLQMTINMQENGLRVVRHFNFSRDARNLDIYVKFSSKQCHQVIQNFSEPYRRKSNETTVFPVCGLWLRLKKAGGFNFLNQHSIGRGYLECNVEKDSECESGLSECWNPLVMSAMVSL